MRPDRPLPALCRTPFFKAYASGDPGVVTELAVREGARRRPLRNER